jgi:hypothetical protein
MLAAGKLHPRIHARLSLGEAKRAPPNRFDEPEHQQRFIGREAARSLDKALQPAKIWHMEQQT